MKDILISFIILMAVILVIGCKKSSNPTSSGDQYSNTLTLGTGMSGFTITGETTNFYRLGGQAIIYWRLESSADMAGSSVRIAIAKQGTNGFVSDTSFTFASTQSYGHIMLSSFALSEIGSFRATGILVTGNVTVATMNFTIQ